MQKLSALIDKLNKETLHPVGLSLVDPKRTAFLWVEVEYY